MTAMGSKVEAAPHYERLILHYSHGPLGESVVRFAADLAQLLQLDFCGLFIEYEAVLNLAAAPLGREIRLPAHQWASLDPERIESEYRYAAEAARRQVVRVTRQVGIRETFDVLRGSLTTYLGTMSHAEDIVVITGSALERAEPLRQAFDVAQSGGEGAMPGILFIPPRVEARQGTIVAVAASSADASIEIAARIALAERAPLLVLLGADENADRSVRLLLQRLNLPAERVRLQVLAGLTPAHVRANLAGVWDRLIVLGRSSATLLEPLAIERQVPVLLTGSGTHVRGETP